MAGIKKHDTLNTSPQDKRSADLGGSPWQGVGRTNMRRPSKPFQEQFPQSSRAFMVEQPSSTDYKVALRDGKASSLMFVAMMSDDLMTKTASHREATDMFSQYQFASRLVLLGMEQAIMAGRKPRKQSTQDNGRPEWQGFLELRLSEGQLAELDDWKPKPSEIWNAVDEMVSQDYRFTLSYNKSTKLASCTIIDDSSERKTGGFALSNADTDGALALKMAIFKHYVLLTKDWSPLLDVAPKVRRG